MAQSPFLVDSIQIEPGSGDTLTIGRSEDGELKFVDATVSDGATIAELAGLRSVPQVLVVGQSGAGAAYTSVQDAIDAVPATADEDDPYVVLVLPGVYSENVTVEKDGVCIVGVGKPTITAAAGDVVTLQASVSVTPKWFVMQGLIIEVQEGGASCLMLSGGSDSELSSTKTLIKDCDLSSLGAGGYALRSTAVNNVVAEGGDWGAGQATTSVRVLNCAKVELHNQTRLPKVQMDYLPDGDVPSDTTTSYLVRGSSLVGDVQADLNTRGSLTFQHCGSVGDIVVAGDRTFNALSCSVGDVTVNATATANLVHTPCGAIAGAGALSKSVSRGVATFAAADQSIVVFDVAMPDDSFTVSLEVGINALAIVTNKSAAGFTIQFPGGVQTTDVGWVAFRG